MTSWKMFAEKSKKVFTDVCFYRFAVEWVKPYTAQKMKKFLMETSFFVQ